MKKIGNKKLIFLSLLACISLNTFDGVYAEEIKEIETNIEKTEDREIKEEVLEKTIIKEATKEEVKEEKTTKQESTIEIESAAVNIEVKTVPTEIERMFLDGTSVSGSSHMIKVDVNTSSKLLYRFYEKSLTTNKWTLIQDYSSSNTAIWLPKKKGDYLYGVDIKEVGSKKDKDISKYVPIRIEPSIPAELHSLDIIGTTEARSNHTIKAHASAVNGVLYRFHIKDEATGRWTMIQDYSDKTEVNWMPSKPGNYVYTVNVKDKNSGEDYEAKMSIPLKVIPLNPAKIESLELQGNRYEKTNHTMVAKASSTNGVLYKFYIKDETSGKWTTIQDYSTSNTATWKPSDAGQYSYYVGVKDKNSEKDIDNRLYYMIKINPPISYSVSNYGDTLSSAADKHMNVSGTKPQVSSKGGWVNATKDQLISYLDPNRFLQFTPEGPMNAGNKEATVTSTTLNVRSGPSTTYGIVEKTVKGAVHNVISEKDGWYMINVNGINGWVSGAYLSFGEGLKGDDKHIFSIEILSNGLHVRAEPNATSQSLTQLKDGNVYIVLEDRNGWRKINAGGKIGWVSSEHTKYVNDVPREMYQFMVLSGQAGVTVAQMNNELKGMGILEGKGAAFIEGSKKHNINELYLMAHAFLETGKGTSPLAKGYMVTSVDGKPVPPRMVYNMYGIGAYDTNPLKGGTETAYKEGWFTPELAISGGAHWIGKNYINNPTYKQDTLYKMRFNPAKPGTHQYATDIGWAFKQTPQINMMMDLCRKLEGIIIKFDIPKYK